MSCLVEKYIITWLRRVHGGGEYNEEANCLVPVGRFEVKSVDTNIQFPSL